MRHSIKGLLEVQEDGVDLAAILQDVRPVVDCCCRKPCWASVRILLDAIYFVDMAGDYMLHYLEGNAGEGDGPVVRWVTFLT